MMVCSTFTGFAWMQQSTDCAIVYQKFFISGVGQRLSPFVSALPVIFFFVILFFTTCWGLFALALKVFLNHCYFYFHERKVLLPSRKILVMHSLVCKYFMCVPRVQVFVSFLKRVSKLAKPNPTMQARASTSLLHEAFSKKILEKFTVVIASWLDCRQLGFTITQKQNDMKNFLVFLNSEEAGLWSAVSVHMKEHLPLSRTRVAERIERNTNETTLHSPTEETQMHKTVAFSEHSSTCWMIIAESCLACVALNFMLMMCLKSSKRRFTCQHNTMTHYCRGLSNKSSKISRRTITQGTQRDLKQEKKTSQCKWIKFLSSL